jgi:hypothetical protein
MYTHPGKVAGGDQKKAALIAGSGDGGREDAEGNDMGGMSGKTRKGRIKKVFLNDKVRKDA